MNIYYKINIKQSGKYLTCISNAEVDLDLNKFKILLRSLKRSINCNGGNHKDYIDNNFNRLFMDLFELNILPINVNN
jgi:translation initiation factor 1 (eIF-1/SUI1)